MSTQTMTDSAVLATRVSSSNADSFISRLPTELVTLILQFAVLLGPRTSLHDESLLDGGGHEYYAELSLIRQVCKRWHDVVETNSTFWIYISASLPPRLFRKIVERAPGGRSLFVVYSAQRGQEEQLLAFGPEILRLSESWTSLYVRFPSSSQLLQILNQPIPRLRKLHVEHSGTAGAFEESETGFRTVSPPLEILEVYNSIFPWDWSGISSLLEIDVDACDLCPCSSQGFINVLLASPRLTSLKLGLCDRNCQPQFQTSTITLQHLASIHFKYCSAAAGLLKAITCPPSTKIAIRDHTRSLTMQNPWVVAAFNHTNFECTDTVCLKLQPDTVVGAIVGNIDLELRPEDGSYQSAAMIQFYKDFLKPFSETNGAQVKTLELEPDLTCDAGPLINTLDSFFPNITSLKVRYYSHDRVTSSSLFDTLAKPFTEEECERRWLLPRIEKLVLDCGYSTKPLPESLIEMIRSRSSFQSLAETEASVSSPSLTPLRELYIRDCTMIPNEGEEPKNILGDTVKFENICWN